MDENMKADIQLELVEKGIQVAKQSEAIDAVDRNIAKMTDTIGDLVTEKIKPPKSKEEVIAERLPDMMAAADKGAAKIVTEISEIIVKCIGVLPEIIKTELKKSHGSKVKAGRFEGCRIIFAGTMSYIVVDAKQHEFVYLTPEYVSCSRCVGKKFRLSRGQTYYYYEIIFKDGTESYVRVSGKHRQNLENCGFQNSTETIFKTLSPGEEYGVDEE